MTEPTPNDTRAAVRDRYGDIARTSGSCCGPTGCGSSSAALGYDEDDLAAVPAGADLALGCGNPGAIAAMKPGETVLDLGSGPGLDCFLAARAVGPTGRVVGVDMTPDMIARARANAREVLADNVEFRLGEIEHLPVADGTVDVVISNCVINLSPEKGQVFREAFRVLRSGGRLAVSDMVATAPLPEEARRDLAAYTGCISGAAVVADLERMLVDAGFVDVKVAPKDSSRTMVRSWMPGMAAADLVLSATIEARRP